MTNLKVSTEGIVVNEHGQVLLIQRDDTFTWAAPGGSLDAGEVPPEGVTREVFEETGLKVLPVRLVGVYYLPVSKHEEFFSFIFRCLVCGGTLTPSAETPRVGFHRMDSPPGFVLSIHKERLLNAVEHKGGKPYWGTQQPFWPNVVLRRLFAPLVHRLLDWKRILAKQPRFQPATKWAVEAWAITQDEQGQVLWLQDADGGWRLPGGVRHILEAPWDTVVRCVFKQMGLNVMVTNFAGTFTHTATPNKLTIYFFAKLTHPIQSLPTQPRCTYFTHGAEPSHSHPEHVKAVAEAGQASTDMPFFKKY